MAERFRTISIGDTDDVGHDFLFQMSSHDGTSLMNSSQISAGSSKTHNLTARGVLSSTCRFPKLEECAHFHYERVQLGKLSIRLIDDRPESVFGSSQLDGSQQPQHWFIMKVSAGRSEPFLIKRSLQNLRLLDEMLHRCVYDRRISDLDDLTEVNTVDDEELEDIVSIYLSRLSTIASDAMTCGPVLTWLQLDNKGRRLPVADTDTMLTINTPAVGAAYGVRRYIAQACDEISIEVGDMISVIDMPSPAESVWWRGKKSHLQKNQYEVGFFPQSCVATIGEKVPRHMPLPAPLVGSLALSPTKPVLRKHGKLITFFRSFILARPSRRRLKQSGIYKERVFSCDLGEHLLNSIQDIPMVLKCCAEFIEQFGVVDGIYRLSGITSNIQKLRRAFDEELIPDLTQPDIKQDIHAVSSLLKMYFRELPNPLCTYQLYDNFVDAIQARTEVDDLRLKMIKQTVRKLPPPHYRTLKYLACHLYKISKHSASTGMTERNIAIVWAPNLLRSPALEAGGVAALRGVGVQAVVTEYLISNCVAIFDDANDDFGGYDSQPNSLSDTSSVHLEQRDLSLSMVERPKSLGIGAPKLISLEEAQIRKNRRESELNKAIPINTTSTHNASSSYIEVGGGPSSLPDKYHTVLPVPRSWNKRKTHSWKSLFQRGQRHSNSNTNIKGISISMPTSQEAPATVEDEESGAEGVSNDLPVITSVSSSNNSSFKENKLTKSADMLDIGKSLIADVPLRSSSIDSLRTAGHSRSVSHDSYFDLLQSPLRSGMTTCPSRELSELGINFDREEPEMRIFSESESLVSSPKVAKDPSRARVLRARPDECGSATNSVNPSPKKQPRLNMQSPHEMKTWATIIQENSTGSDESSCKRYKLEDQLQDIQYIDCNTPEHSITSNAPNTGYAIYNSIQINNPPVIYKQEDHKVIIETDGVILRGGDRYNYPVSYGGATNTAQIVKEDRFSCPVTINTQRNEQNVYQMTIGSEKINKKKASTIDHKHLGRFSYVDGGLIPKDAVPRSCSAADVFSNQSDMNRSKLSVATPQSPTRSPCYSLLVGSTTSSSSSTNPCTPIYDMDICSQLYEPICFKKTKEERDNINHVTQTNAQHPENEPKSGKAYKDAMKKELSLDLNNRNIINISASPTTPNYHQSAQLSDNTNTSQSITPSEIGYQNFLNRQSNVVTPDPEICEVVKPTIVNVSPGHTKTSSINITYKSPVKKANEESIFTDSYKSDASGLLETSFDETMVYEQVKFFKNVILEVNELAEEEAKDKQELIPDIILLDDPEDVKHYENIHMQNSHLQLNEDVHMTEHENEMCDDLDTLDSLEFDCNRSLYENVELRRPATVYENVQMPSSCNTSPVKHSKLVKFGDCKETLLDKEGKSENSVNVRQMATRFETSPVDAQPPFDFVKQQRKSESYRNSVNGTRLKNAKESDNSYNITRSLDENAFIREFGSSRKYESFNRSISQISENELKENSSRRKSVEYARPKSLNPPKKLPGLSDITDKHDNCKINDNNENKLKLDVVDSDSKADSFRITPTTENRISLIQQNFESSLSSAARNSEEEKSLSTTSLKMLGSCKLDRERIEKIKEERRLQLNEKYQRSESFRNLNNNKLTKVKSKDIDLDDSDIIVANRFKSKSRNELLSNLDHEQPFSLITTTSSSTNNLTSGSRVRRISDEKNQNDLVEAESINDATVSDVRDGKFEVKTRQKFEKKNFELNRERNSVGNNFRFSSNSQQHDRYSPQISIKDVAAMFESRSQTNQ